MVGPLTEIDEICARLRQTHASALRSMPQAEVVAAITDWATRWKDPQSLWRRDAQALTEPFPFAMTRFSLEALADSLSTASLWALIDAEGVRHAWGAPLIGHVIAGNTPLLAWTSLLRALLMRSASFVKLPTGGAGDWARLFVQSLADVSPQLASCIHLAQWPGGTAKLDAALCRGGDLLLAYGGQDTLVSLQALCPPSVGFLGYGHRVSFGIVPTGASVAEAAEGFARDILLYDQGGCLSPHTLFVEGDAPAAAEFGLLLADALKGAVPCCPQAPRSLRAAAKVQEARTLARMSAGPLWEGEDLRWTVIAREENLFALSPTHGVVSVQPLAGVEHLSRAVDPVAGHLQGCAVAPLRSAADEASWRAAVVRLGVSWVCRPGQLQAPPFSWREDGRDVLRSLLPTSPLGERHEMRYNYTSGF